MNCTDGETEILREATCWERLAATEVGRLAVCVGPQPDIFPVNHVVDDRTIVFRTAEGTKLAAAVLGRAVAFEVDGYDPESGIAWSVVVKGPAIELSGWTELLAAEDLPLLPWHASHKPRFVRIRPDEVTGRRFHAVPTNGPPRPGPSALPDGSTDPYRARRATGWPPNRGEEPR